MNVTSLGSLRPFALTALLSLAACGGEDEPTDEHSTPDEEACERLQEGPAKAVTAAALESAAPEVANDHHRYDLTLVDVTGGKGGMVKLAVGEAGGYLFFFNKDVPVTVYPVEPGAVATTSTRSSTACTEVALRLEAWLEVGTYLVELGPTGESSVQLVVEPEQHDEGGEE